jgi:hypothetical protein
MLSKEQFLSEVWTKINELSCDPVDAVIETADFNKLSAAIHCLNLQLSNTLVL